MRRLVLLGLIAGALAGCAAGPVVLAPAIDGVVQAALAHQQGRHLGLRQDQRHHDGGRGLRQKPITRAMTMARRGTALGAPAGGGAA